MQADFYQLNSEPFRLSPDPRFCFQHRTYRKAMIYMRHALQRAEGFIMITGRPGTGKTTLIQDLLRTLKPDQAMVANLVTTQMTADDLVRLVAYSFDLAPEGIDKVDLLLRIDRFLKQQCQQGRRPLLIVDEAQDMAEDALEELRLLTNIQANGKQLLQVFLIGQEELRDIVNAPSMEQLHQRMIAATHLDPLDSDDTEAYIKHRLRRVTWTGNPLISKEAYALIQHYSQGIPRQINQICNRLFLHGSIEEKHRLGVEDVSIVVEELRQEFLMPMETASMTAAVPLPGDLLQETYEEEPRRQSASKATSTRPVTPIQQQSEPAGPTADKVTPPTLHPIPDDEPVAGTPSDTDVHRNHESPRTNSGTAQQPNATWENIATPSDALKPAVQEPEHEESVKQKRSVRSILILVALITGLIFTLIDLTKNELSRPAGQISPAAILSDKPEAVHNTAEVASPAINNTREDLGEGTVIRDLPPAGLPPESATPVLAAPDLATDTADTEPGLTEAGIAAADTEPGLTEAGITAADTEPGLTEAGITAVDAAEIQASDQGPAPEILPRGTMQLEQELQQSGLVFEQTGDNTLKVNLSSDGMFAFDSDQIKDNALPSLDALADVLRNYDNLSIQVVGHTDSSGSPEYNLYLSRLRSIAVANYLVSLGLNDSSIQAEGRGDRDTRLEHSAINSPVQKRRVEVYIRQAQEE
jgi:general secretion pathway protein A